MARMGFRDPDGNYWETDDEPGPDLRSGYPPGTQDVSPRPDHEHQWSQETGGWVHVPQPAPLPGTLRPVQWRIALRTGSGQLGWAEGRDLVGLVETHLATLPEPIQAITRDKLEYGDPLDTAEILAFWDGGDVQGVTRDQIEELVRFAATL
jgi:hypothetical protein